MQGEQADIAVIGAGYVGLTTAVCFAHLGHRVVCADVIESRIDQLNAGDVPIVEAGMEDMLREGLASGNLRFVLGAEAASADAQFHYLCVPTPSGPDGSADLSYLRQAAGQIAQVMPLESVVVNKSTVPVGTTRVVDDVIQRQDVRVVSNPEFLREGSAIHDFLNPDRIVIGAEDQAAAIAVAGLYARVPAPIMVTDPVSAEVIKYASNAFLAAKLSYVNAIANLCEAVGADVSDVALGMGYDHRIGKDFMNPGPGWGGSCFPKDTVALLHIAEEAGYDFKLLREAIAVNVEQLDRSADKVITALGGSADGARVGAWGLTFKAGTDDLRESPAIEVLQRLSGAGANITAFDPAINNPVAQLPNVEIAADLYAAVDGADVLVVLTEWDEFRRADFDKVADSMANKCIVDTRNLLDRGILKRRGFRHWGIGR